MPEIYKRAISPFLDKRDSEKWHTMAREGLHWAEKFPVTLKVLEKFAYRRRRFTDERLNVILGEQVLLDNPVMVGAGWDKSGRAVRGLYRLGFSAAEVGGVPVYPEYGNDKPRQWMLGQGVSLNRLGFNSIGVDEVAKNLDKYKEDGIPIGINIGLNKKIPGSVAPEMYAEVVKTLYKYASFFTINVSSPNTPGLQALQEKGALKDIVQAVNKTMDELGGRIPLYIKISPELGHGEIDDVIEVVIDNGATGIIAVNTTTNSDIKAKYGEGWRNEMGGLAGNDEDYRRMANDITRYIFRETSGSIEQIGVGAINSPESAIERMMNGAKAIQVVTAVRELGPTVAGRINRGIADFAKKEGIKNLEEIIGQAA